MNEKNPASLDITHTLLTVLCIGILIAASFWIMHPFLIPLIWAALIAIATWPLMVKLQARLAGRRGLAVTIMTLVILLIVLIPLAFSVLAIVNNAGDIIERIKTLVVSIPLSPPRWLQQIPLAGKKITARWIEFTALSPEDRTTIVTPYAKTALMWFAAKAGSVGMFILQFLLTTIITAILYANGETVRSGILSFARSLAGQHGEDVTILAAQAVRAVALGVVVTAIIQAGIGGIGLFVTGVPGAAILTAVMIMLCLAQVGPALVLIPALIWMYWSGQALWGTVLLIFTLPALILDNIIKPILIKKGANLPLLLIFAGVIGGLIAFGIIGLFIGPVVLAVTYTLFKAWVSEHDGEEREAQADQ
jgi:predicted PurR-regulated permease PerM